MSDDRSSVDTLPPVRIHNRMTWELSARTRSGTWELSDQRAKLAAMDHDTISAGLWALSCFDPALVHLAELRERFRHLDEGDQLRITLDRLTGVYVEGQCRELLHAAVITTQEADVMITEAFGVIDHVSYHVLACTSDPLAMEIFAYALYLGTLTAHGSAPWNRFAGVMADCYHAKHPTLAPACER